VSRHVPHGELIVSDEGSAHSAVHSLAQGAVFLQPQLFSSSPSNVSNPAMFMAMHFP